MKKHIVCFGDSNTHGYCADPNDCADGGNRFNEDERWTCLLQKALGDEYLVLEEGLGGRTTVFADPLHEAMDGLSAAFPVLMTHEPVSLLILMLGTNDTKERFAANAPAIAVGMERLIQKCKTVDCWAARPRTSLWSARRGSARASMTRSWARAAWKNPSLCRRIWRLSRSATMSTI